MTTFSLHEWDDLERGLAEVRRVTRGPIVVLTFDPDRIQPGHGISNLTDRVGALGGRLQISSHPGVGTRVHGEIPLA